VTHGERKKERRVNALIGIVDDDPSILRALTRLLDAAGYAVKTFSSAEEFLALDDPENVDCLVLDVHLGRSSGFDLQERLAGEGISIPIIFITAYDDAVTRERALNGSAVAYVRKPFDERSLLAAIEKALGGG
jgi:FixJ family two-component response regulator